MQATLFVASVIYCFYPFPYLDQVDWLFGYARHGLVSIFAPHNGHRLPVLRLLIVLDLQVFHGRLVPITIACLLALAVVAYILVSNIDRSEHDSKTFFLLGSLVMMLLTRGYTIPDYVTPSTAQFVLSLAFASAALSLASRDNVRFGYLKAVGLGLASAGCGANGLAVFPALA